MGSDWVVRYLLGLRACGFVANGQVRIYHADRLGSVRWVTDGNGNLVASYVYEGFGKVVGQSGGGGGSYQFCGLWGYRNDQDAGLLHVGARYYEIETGRWVQKDPQYWQGYIYCYNDPIAYIDGDGQEPQRVTIPVVDPIIYISVPVLTVPPPPPPSPPICFPRPPIPIIPLLPTEETPWIGIIRPYPGIDISFPYPDPPGPSDCGLKIGVPIVRHPFGLPGDIRFELEKPPGSPRVTTAKISLAIRF